MESNPYQPPATPSDQISSDSKRSSELVNAYRVGNEFYCEPDFDAPRVCLKTGAVILEGTKKSPLWCHAERLEVYLDRQYLRSLNRKQQVKIIMAILSISSVVLAVLKCDSLFIVPAVALFFFGLIVSKERSISLKKHSNGFIQILGAHPDFLRHFPDVARE